MENKQKWITVAEYAALKGITVQAVYKQIKRKGFKLETKVECGKTLILCDSLEEVQQPIKPDTEPVVKPVQQPDSTETVEFLKAEIERLHSVIEAQNQHISELTSSLTDLVKQSNLLVANAQNKLPDPKAEEEDCQSGLDTVEAAAATEVSADTVTVKNEPAEPKEQAATVPQQIKDIKYQTYKPLPKQNKNQKKHGIVGKIASFFK